MALDYLDDIGSIRETVRSESKSFIEKIAGEFGQSSIDQMREDVQKASGTMAQSIDFEITKDKQKFTITFYADDYWDYLNSGVNGVNQSAGAIENSFGEVYSFKTLNPSPSMVEAFGGGANYGKNGEQGDMQNWMASSGIVAANGDYNALAYLLARATKRTGIEPSEFINNAISEDKLLKFEQSLLDALENIF